MDRQRSQEGTKKGPWTAEEDEILINFVKENGPKDWSSIRSKYLLPRTGKSCRLRWVNKLRPNLKRGCKFSAEEERVVLDLQARIGNKWAKIATYLHGRTDNDVKNFWSTRQKRLARMLRSSNKSNNKHKSKTSASSNNASSSQPPKLSCNKVNQESSSNYHFSSSCFCLENSNTTKYMMPQPMSSLPPLVDVELITRPQQSEFSGHSLSQLEGVGTSSYQEFDFTEFSTPNFMEMIDFGISMEKLDDVGVGREVFDKNMFGDLPVDWFDLPESVPKSSAN